MPLVKLIASCMGFMNRELALFRNRASGETCMADERSDGWAARICRSLVMPLSAICAFSVAESLAPKYAGEGAIKNDTAPAVT